MVAEKLKRNATDMRANVILRTNNIDLLGFTMEVLILHFLNEKITLGNMTIIVKLNNAADSWAIKVPSQDSGDNL